ncbi:MAG: branched-chain amino acid ABC transporter permease [Firmicutes bacterium]|nr:branched-chain amino acid ABC transporter permease [Bacillota bacterium]
MDAQYVLSQLANGLAMGSIYALIAIGYSIIYGILKLMNFAHGDTYMFGTFVALSVILATASVPAMILGACVCGALIGFSIERFAYRPIRGSHQAAPMISAVGAALVLRNSAQLVWGTKTYPFPEVIPRYFYEVGGVRFSTMEITIFGIALILMLVVGLLVERTKIGIAVRCVAQSIPTSQLMGIPVNKIISIVYSLGAVLGVAAGILFAAYYNSVFIGMGFLGTMKAFTAGLLGGLGNIYGAFLGGILLGLMEALASGFISSAYRDAISFGVLIVLLLFKPTGLLGKPTTGGSGQRA